MACSTHVIFFKTKCQVLRENRFWILILKILKKTIPRPLPFAKGFVKSLRTDKTSTMEFFFKLKNGEDYRKEAFGSNCAGTLVAGFGVTSALTTGSPKRGDHKCHIPAQTHSSLWRYDGYRDCFGEDCLSSQLLIKAMADVCEIGNTVPGELKRPEEEI
ncbi:hypothetical protein SELMODRAFT_416003 [Selaginella moellendorffii]|uniref:Uncharacterized protein n=1 Tax=Selaginella moellendorffii TaxID=88036 RepID=D8RXS2_SELML|nr:hypothetical protein SELMODRAFT_416003 [Selaginella moellendorffii]